MKLDRRTMLKGSLGGALVTLGLPPLEIFFNESGTAYANGGALPKRFGLYMWGNGVIPDRFTPPDEGENWTLSDQLMPLAEVKSEISVITGMNVLTGNTIPHLSGPAGLLTGSAVVGRNDQDYTFAGPTVDQLIAAEIGDQTRFSSLIFGAKPGLGLSFNGPESRNPPQSSPLALFSRVFGGFTPGEPGQVDPKIRLRRSVLDAVLGEANRLKSRLGAIDNQRIDQHMTGIRELERNLARLEEDPPDLAACEQPEAPQAEYPDVDARPQMSAIARAHADVIAMALACDQTRVFSNFFSYPLNNILFEGNTAGHHRLTHDEPGDQPQVHNVMIATMTELGYFLQRLRDVPEGDSTLLDNCAILATTDVAFGRTHSLEDYPMIIAGTACGALKTGLHYRSVGGENTSKVMLSLLQAMDMPIAEFGTGSGRTTSGLGVIEA